MIKSSKIQSTLLGLAVGDALGLPMEGMSAGQIKVLGWMDEPRHRFIFGKGMVSDDTEHAMMVLESTIKSEGDVACFRKALRWKLKWWFLGLPAGVGMATARACFKMWLGFRNPGVYSAGNGPAMRSVMLGAYFCNDARMREEFVRASTELTHTDPKALTGAWLVAEIAALFCREGVQKEKVLELVERSGVFAQSNKDLNKSCAEQYRKGVSGYILETVPAVVQIGIEQGWDYEQSIKEIIKLGGDTDTTAAILGGLCGAAGSKTPTGWQWDLVDFPRSTSAMSKLSLRCESKTSILQPFFAPLQLMRNIVFLLIVLTHGLRRLLPPKWRRALGV